MFTILFLLMFGTIAVAFLAYHFMFADEGRKGMAEEPKEPAETPKTGRAGGLN